VAIEVYSWVVAGSIRNYGLGMPTCVYGLVFYVAIFALSVRQAKKS
jgi:hypothetical protein